MKNFIQTSGSCVFVSHSAEQVREVCNQVLVLEKGRIGYFGEVEAGLEYYMKLNNANFTQTPE
jgi:ABC-type polysaccharide/polyol phosphate transport system ATPase subunit